MRYLIFIFIVVATFTNCLTETLAATVKVESDFRNFHIGDIFSIDVIVDTEGEILNAVEFDIMFPAEFLAYQDYDDGASVLNIWIDTPTLNAQKQIHLAGITPGGFVGGKEKLITFNFKVMQTGQGNVDITKANFLLHDGLGTNAAVKIQNLHLSATAGKSAIVVNTVDDEIPESFKPEILFDADVFDGQAVLIFSTKDKGSGLDHFEVKEGIFDSYSQAVSPYLIKHQALTRKIYIKAVDKNGNERTEIFYPQTAQSWPKHVFTIMSILMLCVLTYILYYRRFRLWSQK